MMGSGTHFGNSTPAAGCVIAWSRRHASWAGMPGQNPWQPFRACMTSSQRQGRGRGEIKIHRMLGPTGDWRMELRDSNSDKQERSGAAVTARGTRGRRPLRGSSMLSAGLTCLSWSSRTSEKRFPGKKLGYYSKIQLHKKHTYVTSQSLRVRSPAQLSWVLGT